MLRKKESRPVRGYTDDLFLAFLYLTVHCSYHFKIKSGMQCPNGLDYSNVQYFAVISECQRWGRLALVFIWSEWSGVLRRGQRPLIAASIGNRSHV